LADGWQHEIRLGQILPFDPAKHYPVCLAQHRFAWRYLVGFVHPASGRTVFHLASTVCLELFVAELAAFAASVGAGPTRQIVLVSDRAGWNASAKLRVPEHVHLLFLPAYSSYAPELQPAEYLWPLTNTALANRHYVSLQHRQRPGLLDADLEEEVDPPEGRASLVSGRG